MHFWEQEQHRARELIRERHIEVGESIALATPAALCSFSTPDRSCRPDRRDRGAGGVRRPTTTTTLATTENCKHVLDVVRVGSCVLRWVERKGTQSSHRGYHQP